MQFSHNQAKLSSSQAEFNLISTLSATQPDWLAKGWYSYFASKPKYTRLTPANTELGTAEPQLVCTIFAQYLLNVCIL